MSELRIAAKGRGRSQAEDLELELRNATHEILVGVAIHAGVEMPVLPIRGGSSVKVAVPTGLIRGSKVSLELKLRSFPKDHLHFERVLELDALHFRRHVVELSEDEGKPRFRLQRAVVFQWSAGNPLLEPSLVATDDRRETYTLTWPKLGPLENGPALEILVEGEIRKLGVSGTYTAEGETWYVQDDDEETLAVDIEAGWGYYLLERQLSALDDDVEDED